MDDKLTILVILLLLKIIIRGDLKLSGIAGIGIIG